MGRGGNRGDRDREKVENHSQSWEIRTRANWHKAFQRAEATIGQTHRDREHPPPQLARLSIRLTPRGHHTEPKYFPEWDGVDKLSCCNATPRASTPPARNLLETGGAHGLKLEAHGAPTPAGSASSELVQVSPPHLGPLHLGCHRHPHPNRKAGPTPAATVCAGWLLNRRLLSRNRWWETTVWGY